MKSEFFHQKLHEWHLINVANAIENVKGEELDWKLDLLGISTDAWNKIIHRGIRPVVVFAHPQVMAIIPGAVSYYRMLAMVSQKSMSRVGFNIGRYEQQKATPSVDYAKSIAKHLNGIISRLIESDSTIDFREFDLWRGMAAGSQAQGSWQNVKGDKAEDVVKEILKQRMVQRGLIVHQREEGRRTIIETGSGKIVVYGDEPDIGVYEDGTLIVAVEIKGGIDTAGVLEREGATMKSFRRAKEQNDRCTTILILHKAALTGTAVDDFERNRDIISGWYTIDDILQEVSKQDEILKALGITDGP